MRTLFFPGLVAQEVPSCQYLRVALLRVANYTASVVLVAFPLGLVESCPLAFPIMESSVSHDLHLRFIVANVSGPWSDLVRLGIEIRQYGSDDTNRELVFPEGWKQNYDPTIEFVGYRVVEIQKTGTKVQIYYPIAEATSMPQVAGSFSIIT